MRLGRIGLDHVIGYLEGGLAAVADRPDLLRSTERLSPAVAAERLASAEPPLLIDLRTPRERQLKAIPDSVSVPLNRLPQQLAKLPRTRPLIVHCAGGYRSSVGASLLQRAGFTEISEIAGGLAAWEAAGLQLERSSA